MSYTDNCGYVRVKYPNHPFAYSDGYVLEHRLVYEQYYNCNLLPRSIVHHINGIRNDNRIENLQILNQSQHTSMHNVGNTYGKARKGMTLSDETKLKISEARQGQTGFMKHTDEWKAATSERMRNNTNWIDTPRASNGRFS